MSNWPVTVGDVRIDLDFVTRLSEGSVFLKDGTIINLPSDEFTALCEFWDMNSDSVRVASTHHETDVQPVFGSSTARRS
ncbi:hypothetical protein [Gimesia sp.]|uniref:hypothetical protein n=1 Tax=Gimesia sp. TaxID=2024833 RepID=UPI000C367704|nr:hypothetical protein [Gimesia sp.]MAX39760.1 hypothetical protein [Gimesia sp.]HAH44666.1 hypothetical protein [Planctomycetaceae bacterium]HBL42482.1 hypothetical protein [Planctomycetaceae bacterium]|tara:strand:+ start:29107 stop:29343 length:237 start_codon:yes stop_codon:yes gene_type:complete